jgi:hypothetical protein
MKANELRLNNYVMYSDDPVCFLGIGGTYTQVDIDTFKDIYFAPERFEPIPLTEQWLIDFGFEKWKNYYFIDCDYRVAYLKDHFAISVGDDDNGIVLRKVRDVHELQNIYFALIELELKKIIK